MIVSRDFNSSQIIVELRGEMREAGAAACGRTQEARPPLLGFCFPRDEGNTVGEAGVGEVGAGGGDCGSNGGEGDFPFGARTR